MAASRAYLDWNATAPMSDAAKAAVIEAMAVIGNPSSIHGEGRAARKIIEDARAEVAALVAGEAENVFFTSGATEAINAVFAAGLSGCCGKEIACAMVPVVSATEHSAVHAAAGPGEAGSSRSGRRSGRAIPITRKCVVFPPLPNPSPTRGRG